MSIDSTADLLFRIGADAGEGTWGEHSGAQRVIIKGGSEERLNR